MSCLHSYSLLLLDQKGSVGSGSLLSSKFWELYEHMRQVGLDSQPSIKVVKFSRGYPSEKKGEPCRCMGVYACYVAVFLPKEEGQICNCFSHNNNKPSL